MKNYIIKIHHQVRLAKPLLCDNGCLYMQISLEVVNLGPCTRLGVQAAVEKWCRESSHQYMGAVEKDDE